LTFPKDSGEALGTTSSPHMMDEMNLGTTALLTQGGGPREMQIKILYLDYFGISYTYILNIITYHTFI
jgi:hypothetical protein